MSAITLSVDTRQDLIDAFKACQTEKAALGELFFSIDAALHDAPIGTISKRAAIAWNNAPNHEPSTLVNALAGTLQPTTAIAFGMSTPEGHEPGSEPSL